MPQRPSNPSLQLIDGPPKFWWMYLRLAEGHTARAPEASAIVRWAHRTCTGGFYTLQMGTPYVYPRLPHFADGHTAHVP